MEKRKIIMDCDPGIDDAIALAYAAAHPEAFELLAVTTVAGNQTIDIVTRKQLREPLSRRELIRRRST